MAQRLMLTWLTTYPSIYEGIRKVITLTDFTNPLYHRIAELLFSQMDKGKPEPAAILDRFQDVEEQKEVAAVLHAQLKLESQEDRQQALIDVMLVTIRSRMLRAVTRCTRQYCPQCGQKAPSKSAPQFRQCCLPSGSMIFFSVMMPFCIFSSMVMCVISS